MRLVESGGLEFEEETQHLPDGEASGVDYLPIESTRLRYFGGTTNHRSGQSLPLDAKNFEGYSWVAQIGCPISFEEYFRFLPQAQEICDLSSESFDLAFWLAESCREVPLAPAWGTEVIGGRV